MASDETAADRRRIDCRRCRYYSVTWDARWPHGCRAMGFRSRRLPSAIVYESSGTPCEAFEAREGLEGRVR